jgi:hypothetical protein
METPGMSSITQSGIETQSDPLVTVTISGGSSECPGMHAICVRHSHLPELYGKGETTQEAAEDLLRQLLFESAYVDNNRQREVLERAIEEIRNFLNGPSQAAEADSMATISDKDSRIASLPLLWEGETTMKPGLTNLRFQKEPDSATGQNVALEHSGFSEIRAKGSSVREACELLRQELGRCAGWAEDKWHNLDLNQAIEDLEAFTRLSTAEGSLTIAVGDKVFVKIKDVVYQIPAGLYYGGPLDTSGVPRVHTSPDPDQNEEIVIYALGRRGYDRRHSKYDTRPVPRTERRKSDRRQGERREGSRFRMVDSSGNFVP